MIKLNGPLNLNEKTLKPKILGAKSIRYKNKNGTQIQRRLDEDNDLNLGKELMKLSKERNNLSLGQGGGNMMTRTYTLKRFSSTTKTYRIKRKTFGTVGDIGKNVVGTGMEAVGSTVETTGKIAKPLAGIGGAVLGAAKGAAMLGPVGALVPGLGLAAGIGGAVLGSKLGKGAADITKNVGQSIKEGGQDLR